MIILEAHCARVCVYGAIFSGVDIFQVSECHFYDGQALLKGQKK